MACTPTIHSTKTSEACGFNNGCCISKRNSVSVFCQASGHESTPVCAGNRQAAIKPRMPVTRSRQFWKTCCLIWQCLVKLFIGNTVCIASPCVSLLVAWHATTSIDFEQWFPLITLWCDIVLTEKWVEGTTTSCSVPLAHYSLHYIHCSEVYCCSNNVVH